MAKDIFILGYGSLIWDLDDLAPAVRGGWHMAQGPTMPLEFSRISPKRHQALALVIDPRGMLCPTHAIASTRHRVDEAVDALARRERTSPERIGYVDLASAKRSADTRGIAERVAAWCADRNAGGAVWTELESNFDDFSVERAMDYLKNLTGQSLTAAEEYINRAPATTDTPLRRALARDPWWQALSANARCRGE